MESLKRRADKIRDAYRTPKTDDKHIGIELEFSSPIPEDELCKQLVLAGLGEYSSTHNDGGHFEDEENIELGFIVPQSQMKSNFMKLGKLLSELGCKHHSGSGFHVHLDMRYRNPAKAFINLVHTQDILFAIAAQARRSSGWCNKVKHTALAGPSDEYGEGGYYDMDSKSMAISPHLSSGKNTIEVRIRESCVDGLEIYNWVKLLCLIVDAPYIKKNVSNLSQLSQSIKLSDGMRDYIRTKARANGKLSVLR